MSDTLREIRHHLAAIETLLKRIETPAKVTTLSPDEVELEGIIGRPELKTVKDNKLLFTAGLKVTEGNMVRWVSLEAWGATAKGADILLRGDRVRVVGRFKENRYLDSDGVMQVKDKLLVTSISPVVGVSSELTASKANANGTT